MAIAALVLGILSIVFAVFGSGLQWIGAMVGIVGIILGIQGKKDPEKAGMAKAGLICSVIGTVLSLVMFIACVACVGILGSSMSSLYY